MQTKTPEFNGIIPPMATPLLSAKQLDFEGLKQLIDHLISGGVHGLFLLGTTGEGPSISERMKREFIEYSAKEVAGRVPIMVAISNTAFEESIDLANFCAENNVDALVITPPYYYPSGQPELVEYFTHLTRELPLPLFVYNMPMMTKTHLEVKTVRKISEINGIIGIKDSSCNMIYYHELLNEFRDDKDFIKLIGPEELLAESVIFGGNGGIPGGANVYPQLYVNLYNAAKEGNLSKMAELQKTLFILRKIYSCGAFSSSLIKGIKCSLKCLGICNDFMAEPFHCFREEQKTEIIKNLKELNLY